MKRSAIPLIILLAITSVFLGISLIPTKTIKALASSNETFTFTFAQNITTFTPNFSNFTNSYSFPVNVRIYLQTVNKQFLLQNFTLSVNDTSFIVIFNGVTIQNENIFYNLQPSNILVYDASTMPTPTVNNGDTVTINYVTEVYESVIPMPPVPPLPPTHIFDIKITVLPATITYITLVSTTFPATINIINKGIETDATLKWEILDMQGQIVVSEKFTIFLKSSENRTLTLTLPTPTIPGTYSLNIDVIAPAFAHSQKTFTVTVFPLIPVFAVAILILLVMIILVLRKKRKF